MAVYDYSGSSTCTHDGITPVLITLPSTPQVSYLTFTNVSGRIDHGCPCAGYPDGQGPVPGATGCALINYGCGIAALNICVQAPFVGLFLSGLETPSSPPPAGTTSLYFNNNENICPQLDAIFFIGDGLTGTGSG